MADTYSTCDLQTIAYLMANDIRLLDIVRNNSRVEFIFDGQQECIDLSTEILLQNDSVSASRFFLALRNAKKIIHQT